MNQTVSQILKKVSAKINPSEEDVNSINKFLKNFKEEVGERFKDLGVDVDIFVGGSFAKKTLMKKGLYDIDIFARFNESYKGKDISKLLEKAIDKTKMGKVSLIHGSRDYFKIEPKNQNFFIEIIPVIKVKNPKEAENITDLSYFHVNYIRKKLDTEKILEETRLAKAFCHANKCYGAESYINGFSGYALELLIYHYKGFLNFVKAMAKVDDKVIIDIEKLYKNKLELKINMNSAKMGSPIVLIDPTYKDRNALAALSEETFKNFQQACNKFLKNPTEEMFELKKIDFEKTKKNAEKNKFELILLEAKTEKQEGDIAGSKLLKFYKHLAEDIKKFYDVKNEGFEYDGEQEAKYFFTVKKKKEIIFSGPEVKDSRHSQKVRPSSSESQTKENIKKFKQRHKEVFERKGKLYAREKITQDIKEFLKRWMNTNCEKIREMYISELKIEN